MGQCVTSHYQGCHRVTLTCLRMRLSLQLSLGQLEDFTCANLAPHGVNPQSTSTLGEKELNPGSCALIRADTAVLFIIVSLMHIKKKTLQVPKDQKERMS